MINKKPPTEVVFCYLKRAKMIGNKDDGLVVAIAVTATERSQKAWETVVNNRGNKSMTLLEIVKISGAGTTTIKKQRGVLVDLEKLKIEPRGRWVDTLQLLKDIKKE